MREREPLPSRRLWLGVLLAPFAWLVAELAGYYLAAQSCEPHVGGVPLKGTAHPAVTQIVLAVALGIVAVVGLGTALGNWRACRHTPAEGEPAAWGRAQFMSFAGVLASALFVLGIAFFALPPLFVSACSAGR